jgi:PHD/YefM family antitoxin component YafN of YafNO toxin-antitoxin module
MRGFRFDRTKRGKPAVVVLPVGEFQRLSRCESVETPNFVDHLLAMPQDDGAFERGSGALVEDPFQDPA